MEHSNSDKQTNQDGLSQSSTDDMISPSSSDLKTPRVSRYQRGKHDADDDLISTLSPWFCQTGFPATKLLIGINVAIFVAMCIFSKGEAFFDPSTTLMIAWGSDYGPLSLNGEPWRIFTATMLHFGIVHLAINMWALLDFGSAAERLFGTKRFFVTYLFSGIGGSIISLLANPSVVSAGASGALFGVYGCLVAFFFAHRTSLNKMVLVSGSKSAITFIAYNLILGAFCGFDNAAHIGGLLTGFVCGSLFLPNRTSGRYKWTLIGSGVLVSLLALLFIISTATPFDFEGKYKYWRARDLSAAGRYKQSLPLFDQYIKLNPKDSSGYTQKAYALENLEQYQTALSNYDKAVALEPKDHEAIGYRSACNMHAGNYKQAVDDASTALKLGNKSNYLLLTRASANTQLGDFKAVIEDCNELIKQNSSMAALYCLRATAYARLRNYKRALEDSSKAVSLESQKPSYMIHRATVYRDMGYYQEALEELNSLISSKSKMSDQDSTAAFAERGTVYCLLGEQSKALKDLDEAVSTTKAEPHEVYNRAAVLLAIGKYAKVAEDCQKLMTIFREQPKYIYSAIWSVIAYRAMGKIASSERLLQETLHSASKAMWPYPVLCYLKGSISAKELYKQADTSDKMTEVQTYVGMDLALQANKARAIKAFRWVTEHGDKGFVEYPMAKAWLSRLTNPPR